MKLISNILATAVVALTAAFAAQAQDNDTSVHFTPKEGSIKQYQTFKIVFSDAMVAADVVGKEDQASVLEFEPKLKGEFRWKSQTEGEFRVAEQVIPGTDYRAFLRKNTKTLDGRKLPKDAIAGNYESAPLTVTPKFRSWGKNLPEAPNVRLLFNYPVDFTSAPKAIYYQDRDTRERFAAAILIPSVYTKDKEPAPEPPASGSDVSVEPESPLPVGRKIDLIVDGLRDAATRTPIPFLRVFPLGETNPLRIESVTAFGSAKFEPTITINLSSSVDIDTVSESSVAISPDVPNLRRLSGGRSINLQGDFDLTTDYTVTISPPLNSTTGFGLTDPFAKTISFGGYNPEIWFPSQMFFQRSALGLNVKFLHSNTKQVFWKLAAIPDHKIAVVRSRLHNEKELAVESLGLKAVAEGELPGTSTIEAAYRDITWKPAKGEPILSGAYLLEVNTPLRSGKLAGHRAMIFFNDLAVTQKRTPDDVLFKVIRMSDASPVEGAKVRAVRADNQLLATGKTDAEGIVQFSYPTVFPPRQESAHHLLVDTADGRAIQFVNVPQFRNTPGYRSTSLTDLRGVIIADRNLYRPGSTVKLKGIVRFYGRGGRDENNPKPVANQEMQWKILQSSGSKTVASGSSTTDEYGGWEAEWKTPADQKLGSYLVSASTANSKSTAGNARFRVEEYRTPLFNVSVTDASKPAAGRTKIQLQSNYFHGSPNAGAHVAWTVNWGISQIVWDGFQRTDSYSENPAPRPVMDPVSGELRLNADGSAILDLPLPLKKPLYAPGLTYSVRVDVTSPEGRTISSGLSESRPVVPMLPAIKASPVYKENEVTMVGVELRASDAADDEFKEIADVPMAVEMYHVISQTVKEKIAPGVYRYRNFKRYEISAIRKGASGKVLKLPAANPGRYVIVASLEGDSKAPKVSAQVSVAADAPAQYPVGTSTTFTLQPDKDSYEIGDEAVLASESPFAGKAWVSIETYGIHDQFVVDVPANASQITIPIKPEYHPNVYVSVYLVQPGGANHLPVERMGRVYLRVDRPELQLEVEPTLTKEEVEPGKPVTGSVLVSCEGKPLANADVTLMAVDEAVLKLGDWRLPDLLYAFYPSRSHRVSTYQALHNHYEDFEEGDMVEKGFLIGGGGAGGLSQQKMRKNFLARAFWKTQLRTDANGKVAFDFNAPDNLTAFRVTAVASTKESQFGHGKTTLRVAKRLMAEAALPRFVRVGDELELRVVVRQTAMEKASALVKCQTEGGIKVTGKGVAEPTELADGIPQVFRFPAVVTSAAPAVVRFSAELDGHPDIGDAVETKLPVYLPGILQSTGRHGEVPAGAREFKLTEHVPEFWQQTTGSFNLTLSHNPWLPKLTGLPAILDYPHGCLEQKSSRYLGYTVLADLLAFLPDLQGRHENYSQRIGEGLGLYEGNLLSGKFLPYWPGGTRPNYYVTALAAWVSHYADGAGIKVSDTLKSAFAKGLDDIIRGRTKASENTRCFALFVHSEITRNDKKQVTHEDVLRDLYLHRDRTNEESRSLLAITMTNFGILEAEKTQLIREINVPLNERAFDPGTFYSTTRAEAMRFVAQSRGGGEAWEKGAGEARERLLTLMDSSYNLSTQENLWLLIAFKELHDRNKFAEFDPGKILPAADQVSRNKVSVAWKTRGLEKLKDMAVRFESAEPAYYLVDAQVMRTGENMEREDRGIRIERVVHNLTDAKRLGTKAAPFKLGDEVLINYRMSVKNIQHFTALVDELPAALETLNPNLAQVAQVYQLPKEFANATLFLDHSELRDQSANLYFDRVDPGQHSYSILGRITSVGTFTWPSASITPMYEARFGGLTAPNECHVTE
jgi:uncharacterized protein YfaS (alpha-2-macroglobulin family)